MQRSKARASLVAEVTGQKLQRSKGQGEIQERSWVRLSNGQDGKGRMWRTHSTLDDLWEIYTGPAPPENQYTSGIAGLRYGRDGVSHKRPSGHLLRKHPHPTL